MAERVFRRRFWTAGSLRLSGSACGYLPPMMDSPDEVHIKLSHDVRAAGEARQAVRVVLGRWRLLPLIEEVTLVVSELVTNAVKYGLPPVNLMLTRAARQLRVGVHDDVVCTLPIGPASEEAESGRGLAIVAAVTRTSGVEQVEDDGKVVYATFDTPAEDGSGHG